MVSVQHILFNYGVRHMVEDHSDYERGNPQPPLHGLIYCSTKCYGQSLLLFQYHGNVMGVLL